MSAKQALIQSMKTEIEKEEAHKSLETWLDLSSDGDVGAVWYSAGKTEDDFDDDDGLGDFPTEGDEWDEALKGYIKERFADFEGAFDHTAKEEGSSLHVTRCISVGDAEKFVGLLKQNRYMKSYKGVGIFWSWDKDKADCHWGTGKDHILLHGLVDARHINTKNTVMKNLQPSLGEEEAEIEVEEGSPIKVLIVEDSKGKPIWKGRSEVKAFSYSSIIKEFYK